jgi:hypothetical protein
MQNTRDDLTDPADFESYTERLSALLLRDGAISSLYTEAATSIRRFCEASSTFNLSSASQEEVDAFKATWCAALKTAREIIALPDIVKDLVPPTITKTLTRDRRSYQSAVELLSNRDPECYEVCRP